MRQLRFGLLLSAMMLASGAASAQDVKLAYVGEISGQLAVSGGNFRDGHETVAGIGGDKHRVVAGHKSRKRSVGQESVFGHVLIVRRSPPPEQFLAFTLRAHGRTRR